MSKRQALVIGINQYPFDPEEWKLTAAQDAESIAKILEKYGSFEVHRLPCKEDVREVDPEKNVDLKELEDAITQLFLPKSGIIPETALLFFAGHGWRREKNGQFEGFLVTSNALFKEDSEDGLFSLQRLHQILKDSLVQQQIVSLDCCHSGELFNFLNQSLDEFEQQRHIDRFFIAACREFEEATGGVLTPALLEGLKPQNHSDGWVTNYILKDFIDGKLKAGQPQQHHLCRNPDGVIHLTGENGVLANICPYKGLEYFDFNPECLQASDDYKYFYGRRKLTNKLLQIVSESNVIAVLGVSGSGKSSIVRARLLYQLYLGQEIPGSSNWKLYPPFRPGNHPLESLKNVIRAEADQLEAVVNAASAKRVVLVIDQFEEVFTECKDETERQKFFHCLLRAIDRLGNKLCLVLVMRSDFEGRLLQPEYEKLGSKIFPNNLLRVEMMQSTELQEAIIKPAEKVEIEVEAELVTSLVKKVKNSPGYLPLLQFTLDKLWHKSQKKRLINSDLTKLGGVEGALEKHADEIYNSLLLDKNKNPLPNEQGIARQQLARFIFLALTRLNNEDDTRKQVRKEDLLTDKLPEAEELLEQVIKRLADAKLIVTSNLRKDDEIIPVVDIAHGALIRHWSLLRSWLHSNRGALLIRQDIEDAAQKWREQDNNENFNSSIDRNSHKYTVSLIRYFTLLFGQDKSSLISGKKLKEAENFIKLTQEDIQLSYIAKKFVTLSLQRRKYSRNTKALASLLVIFILSALGLKVYFQNRLSLSQNLVKQSEELRKQPAQFQTSMLLAMEAVKIHESPETTLNLWNGLTLLPQNIQNVTNESLDKTSLENKVEFSKTKKYQITILDNFHLKLTQGNKSQNKYEEIYPYHSSGYINSVNYEFSPNDNYLATEYCKYAGCSVVLSDMTNHTKAETENVKLGGEDKFKKITFSYNNKHIATISDDNKIEVWDAKSLKKVWAKPLANELNEIAFTPGDKYLLVTDSSQIRLLDSRTGRDLEIISRPSNDTEKIVFSPDGKYLFSTSQLRKSAVFVSQVWDIETELETPPEVARFTDKDEIRKVTYSSNPKILNIEYRKGTVKQWEPAARWILPLKAQDEILYITFSDDGKYLVAIGQTNGGVSADIWDVKSYKKIKSIGLASNSSPQTTLVYAVLFSTDFKYLFISLDVGRGGYLRQLHETQSGNEISSFWSAEVTELSIEELCKSGSTWKNEKYSARCINDSRIRVKEDNSDREIILSKPANVYTKDFIKLLSKNDSKAVFIRDHILSVDRFKEILSEEKNSMNSNSMSVTKDGKLVAVANATGTENNTITLVSLPQNNLKDEVCQRLTRNFTQEEWKKHLPSEGYRKTCPNLP